MASDAHAHPFDLSEFDGEAEHKRKAARIVCAASAWNAEGFEYNSRAAEIYPAALCFAVHPQLPAKADGAEQVRRSLGLLDALTREERVDAVGECGFDLFDETFRATEKAQDALFEAHLDTAIRCGLPLVLHVRKAMHKVFFHAKRLKKARAVVFHSYSGTADEAAALLRRGVNAYFSFGTPLLLNRKRAMAACRSIEAARLLFETDAPYQRLSGREFSEYADIRRIIERAAELRSGAGRVITKEELERITDGNFLAVYRKGAENDG